jgi:HEAT repeat protein
MWHLRQYWSEFGQRQWPRAVVGGVLLLVVACGGPALAAGQRFPPDPVEELRQALRQDRDVQGTPGALKYRTDTLARYANRITSLGDLGRALLLREWRNESLDPLVAAADQETWKNIGQRFTREAKQALHSGDPERARAAATLVAEMATAVQGAGIRTGEVEQALAGFTPDLVELTNASDPALRTSAIRALGRLGLQATGVLKALEHTLLTDGVPQRRAAADSLISLIRIAAQSEKEGATIISAPPPAEVLPKPRPGGQPPERPPLTGVDRPITAGAAFQTHNTELIDMSARVVPVAGIAVRDPDAEVRRLGGEATLQAAQNLTDSILLPVAKEFPPPGRPVTPDERDEMQRYRQEVHNEYDLLKPLMEALKGAGAPLAGAARDPVPAVRLEALRTLEQIGYAREKLLRRWQSMPTVPKETESPRDDTSKEKAEATRGTSGTALVRLEQQPSPLPPHPPANLLPADPLLQGLEQALGVLIANLYDRDVHIRLAAIDALEMLGEKALPAVPAMIRALGDRDLFVRWAAARTLGKMVPEGDQPVPDALVAAVPGLARLLSDEDLDLRLTVENALGRFGPAGSAAVPALAQAVAKGDTEARVGAIDALGSIGTTAAAAIPQVTQQLSDPDARLRLAACRLLARFGPVAEAAADPLRALLNDPDPDVRRAASDAQLSILRK